MEISASLVKELRDDTGASLGECKKALVETEGNVEAAKQKLRERGATVAEKRAGREAGKGAIASAASPDKHKAALVQLRCETDFVARNADFVTLAQGIADAVLAGGGDGDGMEAVLKLKLGGTTIADAVTQAVGKIGERIELGRVTVRETGSGTLDTYIHHDKTKGVMVEMAGEGDAVTEVGHSIAVHIAWADPEFISRDEIDPERIAKELEIEKVRAINEGKPEAAAEQIAKGRVNKAFFQRVSLLDQMYLGQHESVQQLIDKANSEGAGTKVLSFVRYAVGA
jgi:elongation factor Ts